MIIIFYTVRVTNRTFHFIAVTVSKRSLQMPAKIGVSQPHCQPYLHSHQITLGMIILLGIVTQHYLREVHYSYNL